MGGIKLPTFVVYKKQNNTIMKTKITLNQVILAMWTVNATLVLIGATAVVLDQLNFI